MATHPSISVSSISPATITSSGSTVSNGTIYWSIAGQSEAALDATKTNYYADKSNWDNCYYWSGISGQSTSFNGLSKVVDISKSVTVYNKTVVKSSSGSYVGQYTSASAAQAACDAVAGSAGYIYEYTYNSAYGYRVYKYTLSVSTSSYSANAYAAIDVSGYINTQGSSGGGSTGGDTGGGDTGGDTGGGGNTTPTTKHGLYIGVSGKARKIKKLYIGVNGVAKKIKKAYIGVGGKARLIYRAQVTSVISHAVGASTMMSTARRSLGATTIGNYALFGGGTVSSGSTKIVDSFNSSLTRENTTALNTARSNPKAITLNNTYAFFVGGNVGYDENYSNGSCSNITDIYTATKTLILPTITLTTARKQHALATIGNYVLVCGGRNSLTTLKTVETYNSSLTHSSTTDLGYAKFWLAATNVGDYALVGGGYTDTCMASVDAYNSSLTRSSPANLYHYRYLLSAGSIDNYAIFFCGNNSSYADFYDKSLTHTYTNLNTKVGISSLKYSVPLSFGNYILFAGGESGNESESEIYAFDSSLTLSTVPQMKYRLHNHAGTVLNDYAILAGGQRTSYHWDESEFDYLQEIIVYQAQYN